MGVSSIDGFKDGAGVEGYEELPDDDVSGWRVGSVYVEDDGEDGGRLLVEKDMSGDRYGGGDVAGEVGESELGDGQNKEEDDESGGEFEHNVKGDVTESGVVTKDGVNNGEDGRSEAGADVAEADLGDNERHGGFQSDVDAESDDDGEEGGLESGVDVGVDVADDDVDDGEDGDFQSAEPNDGLEDMLVDVLSRILENVGEQTLERKRWKKMG
ncbi:hypothetical protein CDD82_6333 [Ophiocordyceps australis]|uniref:Uncharacterized protein n=1 Tax=Ophiocordyceps australis TaxID=1399860 RepID=A0A2C5YQJ0_9HYPO|nr:hypothetical protein CDD82_6333 [Ophiocordyceps australis]